MARFILKPVLTNYGTYRFEKISLEETRKMARSATSAIGHEGAAETLPKARVTVRKVGNAWEIVRVEAQT